MLNFGAFQTFGCDSFVSFLKFNLDLMLLMSQYIDVLFAPTSLTLYYSAQWFPSKAALYFENVIETAASCLPIILEFLDLTYLEGLFKILFRMFEKAFRDFAAEIEFKTVHDDSVLLQINSALLSIGTFLEEEISLHKSLCIAQLEIPNLVSARCSEFLSKNRAFLFEFASLVLEACLSLNYNSNVSNIFSEIILVLLVLDQNVLSSSKLLLPFFS